MGSTPDRITKDEFVTPPELQAWRLAANPAGRIGGVRLKLAIHDGKTILADCFQQVPLRVLPPYHMAGVAAPLIYLLNPTAGLLDGDAQLVQIHAGAGTRALVVGQSATRVHPAVRGFCTQQFKIHVERDARVVVLPGPTIPFQGCRYVQRVEVTLAPGASFVWGDLWHAGRHTRGAESERFQFECMVQEMTVRREGTLAYRDRFVWRGPCNHEQITWHYGSHLGWAGLFTTGRHEPKLAAQPTLQATFATAFGDTCMRWLGDPETLIGELVGAALAAADGEDDSSRGFAKILSGDHIAPNHWFKPYRRAGTEMPTLPRLSAPPCSGR